jgi:uncharacterized membrane protein (UPF0127 family)
MRVWEHVFLWAVIVALVYLYLSGHQTAQPTQVCFKSSCVSAEIADNDESRRVGLMNRTSLAPDAGMLFVFESDGIYPFWMKDTRIPLDMIWLDSDLKVVDIKHAVPCGVDPCPDYIPSGKAKYVLEVNEGYTDQKSIRVGDRATFKTE